MATMTLEQLVAQLRAAHGDALAAVVLYGSAARGDTHGTHSDRNVLVVVREFVSERLGPVAAVTRSWSEGGDPALLTLTVAEWMSSVDVFAIEHADVQQHHRLLYSAAGFALFAGVPAGGDMRRQLEYEAMALLLRLRAALLGSGRDGKQATAVLTGSVGSVLALFRAAVRLEGAEPFGDSDALCKQVAAASGVDVTPFLLVVAHRRTGVGLTAKSAPGVLEQYHRGVQQFVAWVDALPTSV